jgi:hypothetical protein
MKAKEARALAETRTFGRRQLERVKELIQEYANEGQFECPIYWDDLDSAVIHALKSEGYWIEKAGLFSAHKHTIRW